MQITATELKLNLGKYLDAANDEEVLITKNGKAIARLTGVRAFTYDLSALDKLKDEMAGRACMVGEASVPAYGSAAAATPPGEDGMGEGGTAAMDGWMLMYNGEPIAGLTPLLKQKRKRRIGFIEGPPASEETIAALFESEFTDEIYEKWLNEEW